MPGLFEALGNMSKREPKKFFITVEGKDYEVTLEKKQWARQHGEENLMIKDGEIVLRSTPIAKTQYSTLKETEKGYVFQDDDIHWPTAIADGGKTWMIERE